MARRRGPSDDAAGGEPPAGRGRRARRLRRRLGDGWVAFEDTCTHEECSLVGGRARRHRRRLPVPRLRVRRPHGRRAHARPRSSRCRSTRRAPRRARCRSGWRRRPPPTRRRTPATTTSPRRRLRAATVAGPSLDGLALDDVDLTDLDTWERGRAVRLARAPAPRRAGLLAAGERRARLLGAHALRRRRRRLEGLGDVLERARRHLAAGPDARRSSRRGSRCSTPTRRAHTRMRAIVNKGFTPRVINAYEERIRELARGILDAGVRAGRRSTGSRPSPRRSRCGSSPRSWACRSTTGS